MTRPVVRRLNDRPIIHGALFNGAGGKNINGPSLIAAPPWLRKPLGRFYLYFAHHGGDSIRLAFADRLEGPWSLVEGGTLRLADASACRDHIASPDVHLDDDNREIVMFFHGVGGDGRQMTYLARSSDGIRFTADAEPRASFYFRAVRWRDIWIGMSKGGVLYVADRLTGSYRRLPKPAFPMRDPDANAPGDVRHVALKVEGDRLSVYYSRIGDAPERIYRAWIDLVQPCEYWEARRAETILAPQRYWEGRGLPVKPSRAGPAHAPENALRDPAIFLHEDRTYLLYSGAGETNIGIVELMKTTSLLDRFAARFERAMSGETNA